MPDPPTDLADFTAAALLAAFATRNPWDPDRTPGGSSSGAAVAAATGMAPLHIGTDGGGSIRIPAAFCGIFGLKPSFGRVPAYPPSPFRVTSHVGPMTRSVGDAALMLTAMSGPDPRDPFALPPDGRDYGHGIEDGVGGLRIAVSPTLGFVRPVPAALAAVERAARRFAGLGAVVEAADPGIASPRDAFFALWAAAAAARLRDLGSAQRKMMDP